MGWGYLCFNYKNIISAFYMFLFRYYRFCSKLHKSSLKTSNFRHQSHSRTLHLTSLWPQTPRITYLAPVNMNCLCFAYAPSIIFVFAFVFVFIIYLNALKVARTVCQQPVKSIVVGSAVLRSRSIL